MGNILNKNKKKSLKKEKKIQNTNADLNITENKSFQKEKQIKSLNDFDGTTKKYIIEDLKIKEFKFLKNLVTDSYGSLFIGNIFITFISTNNIFFLIYSNQKKSIISYDLINFKKINEVKNAHNSMIANFNHYLDHNNNRDLILSISSIDNNIKIWNVNNFECLLNIKKINNNGFLDSACFLNYNNQIFIISSNANNIENIERESIKIFDFKGKKIKELEDSNEDTYFVDTYYDNKLSTIFIIVCCVNYSKSYDYKNNKLYHKYLDLYENKPRNIVINNSKEIVEIFESSYDGNLRIWNLHSGMLLKKIRVAYNTLLRGICFLDNEIIFIGCDDKTIRLVNYKNGKIMHIFSNHIDRVVSIKIIIHQKYGQCLLSQAAYLDPIKIWTIKSN